VDQSFINLILSQTGLAGIAIFCIYITNRVWSERTQDHLSHRIEEREDKLALLAAYKDNVTTMNKVATTLDHQADTLDRLSGLIDRLQK